MTAPNDTPLCEVCLRHTDAPHNAVLPGGRRIEWVGCFCEAPEELHAFWQANAYPHLPRRPRPSTPEEVTEQDAHIARETRRREIATMVSEKALAGELVSALDGLSDSDIALIEDMLPPELQRTNGGDTNG